MAREQRRSGWITFQETKLAALGVLFWVIAFYAVVKVIAGNWPLVDLGWSALALLLGLGSVAPAVVAFRRRR